MKIKHNVFYIVIGIIIGITCSVTAATSFDSSGVSYNDTTVKDSLDGLYTNIYDGKKLIIDNLIEQGVSGTLEDDWNQINTNINSLANIKYNNGLAACNNEVSTESESYKAGYDAGYAAGLKYNTPITLTIGQWRQNGTQAFVFTGLRSITSYTARGSISNGTVTITNSYVSGNTVYVTFNSTKTGGGDMVITATGLPSA